MLLYHVTEKSNLESIKNFGLIPYIGPRSTLLDEEPSIFFFGSMEDVENALMNWLGEQFEDEDLVVLHVEVNDSIIKKESDQFEYVVTQCVPFDCVKHIDYLDSNSEYSFEY